MCMCSYAADNQGLLWATPHTHSLSPPTRIWAVLQKTHFIMGCCQPLHESLTHIHISALFSISSLKIPLFLKLNFSFSNYISLSQVTFLYFSFSQTTSLFLRLDLSFSNYISLIFVFSPCRAPALAGARQSCYTQNWVMSRIWMWHDSIL